MWRGLINKAGFVGGGLSPLVFINPTYFISSPPPLNIRGYMNLKAWRGSSHTQHF